MMKSRSRDQWVEMLRGIEEADTDDFVSLVKASGLDPATELRFGDFSGVSFKDCDLGGFDFFGSRLIGCDFRGARISQARFGLVIIDDVQPSSLLSERRTNLRAASDWAHCMAYPKAGEFGKGRRIRVGEVFQDAPFAPETIVVPAGTFWMGSPDGSGGDQGDVAEKGRRDGEGPCHLVTIAEPFAVGRFAVTFEEWEAYAEAAGTQVPDDMKWGKGRRPVIKVSWDDAQKYIRWLNSRTGQTYRLLTEAEWEYCCRAGTATRYAFGENITTEQGRFYQNVRGVAKKTVEVGSFAANDFGLYDMHGNVWEWCQDSWHSNYRGAPDDGTAWQSGNESSRVLRGGSWLHNPGNLRSAGRHRLVPSLRLSYVGFRVARTLLSHTP